MNYMCVLILKGRKYSAHYEETDNKTDSIPYAVSPQALSEDKQSTIKKDALQYDYVTTGQISVRK